MSGSFGVEGGQIVIRRDGRRVATTEGQMFMLLTDVVEVTNIALNYPDFQKDIAYNWQFVNDPSQLAGRVAMGNACFVDITAKQQDWSETQVLAAAPEGADFVTCMARITGHPNAPNNSWGGSNIETRIPQGPWFPMYGSALIEAEFGMARAFSLYLEGGNLVLHRQQSVSTPAGGYGRYGDTGYSPGDTSNTSGGQNYFLNDSGLPIYRKSGGKSSSRSVQEGFGAPRYYDNHRYGEGNDQCDISDTTDYGSDYVLEVRARFGRRS